MADKETRNFIRSRMFRYNEYKKEILLFEESIRYPWKESDENIVSGCFHFGKCHEEEKQ